MKRKRRDIHSVEDEPALSGGGGNLELDPSEAKVVRREQGTRERPAAEIDVLRDSVRSEPSLGESAREGLAFGEVGFRQWLEARKARVGMGAMVLVTLLAGLAGGPFAIVGALAKSSVGGASTLLWLSYVVVLGPLIEEMLKQSGSLFLLERRPYWLKRGWQFPVIAVISAALFATIENLMYISGPLQELEPDAFAAAASFRWRYCTLLHIGCSLIASVGMYRVWQRQVSDGAPARLSVGYNWIVAAVVCHGVYNLAASTVIRIGE